MDTEVRGQDERLLLRRAIEQLLHAQGAFFHNDEALRRSVAHILNLCVEELDFGTLHPEARFQATELAQHILGEGPP